MTVLPGKAILAGCILLLVGCSNEDQSPIVGAWKNTSSSQFGRAISHYEFRTDGSYTWQVEFPDFEDRAREQMHTFLFASVLSTAVTGKYSISAEELTLSPEKIDGMLAGEGSGYRPGSIAEYDYFYPYEIRGETLLLYVEDKKPTIYTRQSTGLFDRWFN